MSSYRISQDLAKIFFAELLYGEGPCRLSGHPANPFLQQCIMAAMRMPLSRQCCQVTSWKKNPNILPSLCFGLIHDPEFG